MRGTLRSLPLLALLVLASGLLRRHRRRGRWLGRLHGPIRDRAATSSSARLSFERGPYKLTVLDTDQLNCDDAQRGAPPTPCASPGAELPEGWKFDMASRGGLARGTARMRSGRGRRTEAAATSGDDGSFWSGLEASPSPGCRSSSWA